MVTFNTVSNGYICAFTFDKMRESGGMILRVSCLKFQPQRVWNAGMMDCMVQY